MLLVWLVLAAVFSVGASAASVVEQPRNAGIFYTGKLLILSSALPSGFDRMRSDFSPLLRSGGLQVLPIQFHGATDSHSRVAREEWRDQRFKPLHLSQLLPVGLTGLRRTAWIGIELDLSFQRGNHFPILFQGVFLDFCGNILKSLKFGKGQPYLKRIRFAFDSSSPLHHAINGGYQISPIERIDQWAMVGDEKGGDFSRGSIRHGVQRGGDDALQVSIHRCVKYAPDVVPVQWISRNRGTTTGGRTAGNLRGLYERGLSQRNNLCL
jgi:hypothetical protein